MPATRSPNVRWVWARSCLVERREGSEQPSAGTRQTRIPSFVRMDVVAIRAVAEPMRSGSSGERRERTTGQSYFRVVAAAASHVD